MTRRDFLLEGTPGANVTTGTITSTPTGLVATSVAAGGSNAAHTFSDAKVQSGNTSCRMTTAVSTAGILRLPFFGTSSSKFAVTFSHYTDTTLLAGFNILNVRSSAGTANGFRLGIKADGAVFLANATVTVAETPPGAWQKSVWNHFQLVGDFATGTVSLSVFRGTSRVPVATLAGTYTFTTEGNAVAIDLGTPQNVPAAQTGGMTHWFDSVLMDDGRETQIPFLLPVASGDVSTIPGAGSGSSGWTIIGDAADEGTALNDGVLENAPNLSTGIQSPDITSTPTARKYKLSGMSSRTGLTLTFYSVSLTSGTASPQVKFYQGSTLIATKPLTATTTPADRTVSLTTEEAANITDWEDVYFELVA